MTISFSTSLTQRPAFWTEWKVRADSLGFSTRFAEDAETYTVYGYDGIDVHICTLYKNEVPYSVIPFYSQEQNDDDKADFETNYKPNANKRVAPPTTSAGQPIITPAAFAYVAQKTRFTGFRYVATPDATTIFDEEITTQVFVQGGKATLDAVEDGDMVEFSIVDKNDVLGLFGLYGLTPGVDVLELDKYVRHVYPRAPNATLENRVEAAAAVVSGLFFRITYTAIAGGADRIIKPMYLWYEV